MRPLLPAVLLLACSAPAAAQTDSARWRVSVSGGVQSQSRAVTDRSESPDNLETTTTAVGYRGNPDALFDAGVGFRLWKSLGVGFALTRFTHEGSAGIDRRSPHPFFFGRPRTISGDIGGVTRAETGAHIHVLYHVPVFSRLHLVLSGGPSVLHVEQALVDEVQYDDQYPYDTATFRTATTRPSKASATGFNVGADLSWMFMRHVGAGLVVRGSRGRVRLDTPDDRVIRVDAGGAQGAVGLRLVF